MVEVVRGMASRSRLPVFLKGVAAGCVLLTVELGGRVLFQVPTVPELIQDRLVQSLPGPVFAYLLEHLLYLGKPSFFASLLAFQAGICGLAAVATSERGLAPGAAV